MEMEEAAEAKKCFAIVFVDRNIALHRYGMDVKNTRIYVGRDKERKLNK